MSLRVLRPSIDVEPTSRELDQLHQNIVSYADRGKVFAIEVLVEGVCLAGEKHDTGDESPRFFHQRPFLRRRSHWRSNSTDDPTSSSALSLVYDEQYHKILMKHSDVTMGVTSGIEGNQVANLLRNLVNLYNGVRRAAVERETARRRDAVQHSLKQFAENLATLAPKTPAKHKAEFDAYHELYRNLIHLSEQVLSGTILKIDHRENVVQSLPSALRVVGEVLRRLDEKDSVKVVDPTSTSSYEEIYKSVNAIILPTERLICGMLIIDLWLLEDWNYEREL